jgi:hypothetical protein
MFDSGRETNGTGYTSTVALVIAGCIFSPAVLAVSRPFGYRALALAVGSTLLCMGLAWVNWTKGPQFPTASIANRPLDGSRGAL